MHHNKVLQENKGELKVVRWPPPNVKGNPYACLPCMYCYRFLHKGDLYHHVRICEFVKEHLPDLEPKCLHYNCSLSLSTNKTSKTCSRVFVDHVFSRIKQDEISLVAKGDEVITMCGGTLLHKHGSEKVNLISQYMRDPGYMRVP